MVGKCRIDAARTVCWLNPSARACKVHEFRSLTTKPNGIAMSC